MDLAPFRFEDVTSESGVDFVHSDGSSGRLYVIEPFTAGCAVLDYDGDELLDLYFLNGSDLPGTESKKVLRNSLFRNIGDFRFVDVTEEAGVGDRGYGMGVTAADYDNDGHCDLYVSNFGENKFYINNGDGTFRDGTSSTRTSGGNRFGAGTTFFDADSDGFLDLYVANYQVFRFEKHIERVIGDQRFHPGPADYPPDSGILLHNDGDGTFSDISQRSGISNYAGTGMAVVAWDCDLDGDSDLFVANDSMQNFLFLNDGKGNFRDEALPAGLAYDGNGKATGNMGIDVADFDGDQQLDLITTTYQNEMPILYRGVGRGLFEDVTNRSRLTRDLSPHVKWGVNAGDFDNDADVDIFVACGHFMQNARFVDDRTSFKVKNFLLENRGRGTFRDVSSESGPGLSIVESSRGSIAADLDHDGDLDIVVQNFNAPSTILRNNGSTTGNWIKVKLVGTKSNRQSLGATVTVKTSTKTQIACVLSGKSYQGSCDPTLHFGVGAFDGPVDITVNWPANSSNPTKLYGQSINQVLVAIEPTN